MKILSRYLLKSFIAPFLFNFLLIQFILVLQFLWRYIDELAGKGLEWYVIVELLFYASAHLVPMALPLAVLLASIMVFGSLGETLELTAVKSSGISFFRFLQPLFGFVIVIAIAAFFFSNYVLPLSNLKFGAILYDVRSQKPALAIKPGVFYKGIDGFVLKVGSKDEDNKTIHDVFIYDHSDNRGNYHIVTAKKGEMTLTDDKHFLILKLYKGYNYEELVPENGSQVNPTIRTSFDEQQINFDLASFKMNRTEESLFKDHHSMMNINQLTYSIDSLKKNIKVRENEIFRFMNNKFGFDRDLKFDTIAPNNAYTKEHPYISLLDKYDKKTILIDAQNNVSAQKSYLEMLFRDTVSLKEQRVNYVIEWHRKFTLSVVCIVLFLIGAPLGGIIRKGGLGVPLFVSIVFFVVYHVISITAEKSAKELVITPFVGMWFAIFCLLPVGLLLLYASNNDSKLLNFDFYRSKVMWVFNKLKRTSA